MLNFVVVESREDLERYVYKYCMYINLCTGDTEVREMLYNGVMSAIATASGKKMISYIELLGYHTLVKNPMFCNAHLRACNGADVLQRE